MFRVIVQDSRRTPSSGKVVARLGSYDPHAKTITLDKEKASFYLEHGAQPSGRVAVLLKSEGVKLPDWVQLSPDKKREVRNADKRRSTRPEEAAEEAPAASDESAAETAPSESAEAEAAADQVDEAPASTESEASETQEEPAETEAPAASEKTVDTKVSTQETAEGQAEPETSSEEPAANDAPAEK